MTMNKNLEKFVYCVFSFLCGFTEILNGLLKIITLGIYKGQISLKFSLWFRFSIIEKYLSKEFKENK